MGGEGDEGGGRDVETIRIERIRANEYSSSQQEIPMPGANHSLLTIGIFYDGNFFKHVSGYYKYEHSVHANISIHGLHEFITHYVASQEKVDVRYVQIVESHYFSGRLVADLAEEKHTLYHDRVFDEILMSEGVEQHYLPVHTTEKGIDVWLAIEALELSMLKHFSVVVLFAGDADFVPLARKLTSLGIRVMVIGCDFIFMDGCQKEKRTLTSTNLKRNCTYLVMINELVENLKNKDPLIEEIFYSQDKKNAQIISGPAKTYIDGITLPPRNGYGFIKCSQYPQNAFYHYTDLININFENVTPNMRVRFVPEELNDGSEKVNARDVEVID
jgi:uncharacterized LabA/DUF88 family protein